MTLQALLPQILLVLGLGFLVANVRLALDLIRWRRRRHDALITWPGQKPPFYGLSLGIGVSLGVLILVKAYLTHRSSPTTAAWLDLFFRSTFGELMMFVYFGYMLPLSTRISRGLYADGIWTDTSFLRWDQVGGVSWREGPQATLIVLSRVRAFARRLAVPSVALGEVRRLLRDKIHSHAIETDDGPGIHLGARDARDGV